MRSRRCLQPLLQFEHAQGPFVIVCPIRHPRLQLLTVGRIVLIQSLPTLGA